MATATHRAEVVPVIMEKHPDADSLSIVKVFNFTCVVRTQDWLGVDKAVYLQPDSIVPDTPQYRFLKETVNLRTDRVTVQKLFDEGKITPEQRDAMLADIERKIDGNTKYLRLAAKRLRGIWSMGMLVPLPTDLNPCAIEIGDDLADYMGITHYEPPPEPEVHVSNRHTGADVGPAPPVMLAPTYDIESAYRYAGDCFSEGELVYVTEKVDGQNARFVATAEGNNPYKETTPGGQLQTCTDVTMYAGSRAEWKLKEGESNWWRVQEQSPWITEWCHNHQDRLLYGEVFGWVQKLHYGATLPGQLFFRAFDILDGTTWLDAQPFIDALSPERRVPQLLGDPTVTGSVGGLFLPYNFERMAKLADGPSLVPGANHMREGIVVRPLVERFHRKVGRVILKFVSNAYLEKSSR